LKNNTLKTLKLMVSRRMLIKLRKKTPDAVVDSDSEPLKLMVKEEMLNVRQAFFSYVAGTGAFGDPDVDTSESDTSWTQLGGVLKFYAIRVTNMIVTISDVERTHKVYSLIHTSSRARTSNERVDRLSLASIILKSDLKPKPYFKGLKEFQSLTKGELDDIVTWGEVMASATRRTARSIQMPLDEMSFVAESVQNDTENTTAAVGEVPIEEEILIEADNSDSDSEEEIDLLQEVEAPEVRRSSRRARFTANFIAAGDTLGLSSDFFN
jgi:hypothetical protein